MPRARTPREQQVKNNAAQADKQAPVDTIKESPARGDKPSRLRNVFNGTVGKLTVRGTIPGYHLHILNDLPGRIDLAVQGGYEFVLANEIESVTTNVSSRNTDVGDKVRFLVGKNDTGTPLYAYLMKQRLEWYDEDQAALAEKNQKIDDAIKRGKTPGTTPDNFYVPRGGIKMS